MSPRYAENTSVSSEKSRAEIERIVQRYGADQFAYGWDQARANIGFRLNGRMVRFSVDMPDIADDAFVYTPARRNRRRPEDQRAAWEQACRQRWRALALVIKAKMEAVEAGITTFDEEFMAHILLPSGERVGDWMAPQIAAAYDTGRMPPLLPAPGGE